MSGSVVSEIVRAALHRYEPRSRYDDAVEALTRRRRARIASDVARKAGISIGEARKAVDARADEIRRRRVALQTMREEEDVGRLLLELPG